MLSPDEKSNEPFWFLEGYLSGTKRLWRVQVRKFPFRIGRRPDLDLTLSTGSVSQEHAVLMFEEGRLYVRDLSSTNGTFVNRKRITEDTQIEEGDIIHFSVQEFRVGIERPQNWATTTNATRIYEGNLPHELAVGTRQFLDMLRDRKVMPLFQPICDMQDGSIFGYELLGRGDFDGLPKSPGELFRIASSLGMEAELSMVFRQIGVEVGRNAALQGKLFVNMHPVEAQQQRFLESLAELRKAAPELPIILEIHEAAVANVAAMRELRVKLADMKMGLAYDDFGAGQARLLELVEAPPDVLKFDMALIRGIDRAGPQKQQLLASLIGISKDLGILNLAEGIEDAEETRVCREMGFALAQGYYFGKPAAAPTALKLEP